MNYHIIHHSDADGHASAMVVWDYLTRKKISAKDIYFSSINYGIELRPKMPIDYENDEIYLVDFCFQPAEKMLEFARKAKHLIWIDHHHTTMEYLKVYPELQLVPGLNCEGIGACKLCWEHFFPHETIPAAIDLISRWDVFDRSDDGKFYDAQAFLTFLDTFDSRPFKVPMTWVELFHKPALFQRALSKGEGFLAFRRQLEDRVMRTGAFTGKFAGHKALFINTSGNSLIFERFPNSKNVDLWVMFQMKRGGFWVISLYTPKDVDCGALAKKLGEAGPIPGGGGHPKAAGFETDWNYFWSLVSETSFDSVG